MGRRPIATVKVIHRPDFGPLAIEVEIRCPDRVTGLLNVLGEARPELRGALLIAAACFEHETRCGGCDLSEARDQADVLVKAAPGEAWVAWREERRQGSSATSWGDANRSAACRVLPLALRRPSPWPR